MANTDSADINEIQLGYFLSNDWKNFTDANLAKVQLETKKRKVGESEFLLQTEKAHAMSDEVIKWAKANNFRGNIVQVWWTARPGILSKAVGVEVDSRKNPTDILIKFTDGKFLGLSAKSTKKQGDIGFKNPGFGTIAKSLNIFNKDYMQSGIDKLLKKFPDLSKSAAKRKTEIRSNIEAKKYAEELGTQILKDISDELYTKLKSMNREDLVNYLLNDWMDAKEIYPRYIKVTGMKKGAKIEDPLSNTKIDAITSGKIVISKVGNDSVGISAGGKRIMKMRAKFESQKLASSIKFSGDPW
jgi:hypothetical protein